MLYYFPFVISSSLFFFFFFFFSSRRRHTRWPRDWSQTCALPISPDELLLALDEDQRRVATALRGPVCVLAGAGTGKTRAITYRIAHGVATNVYQPQNVLAVTFTARAAAEMRSRLRGLGVPGAQARTFHSAALRQLSFFWPRVIGGAVPRLGAYRANLAPDA